MAVLAPYVAVGGDREGAAVTRHNLNLLGGFGGNNGPEGSGGWAGRPTLWPLIVGTIVVMAILGLVASLGEGEGALRRVMSRSREESRRAEQEISRAEEAERGQQTEAEEGITEKLLVEEAERPAATNPPVPPQE